MLVAPRGAQEAKNNGRRSGPRRQWPYSRPEIETTGKSTPTVKPRRDRSNHSPVAIPALPNRARPARLPSPPQPPDGRVTARPFHLAIRCSGRTSRGAPTRHCLPNPTRPDPTRTAHWLSPPRPASALLPALEAHAAI
jgi:hypothetical protein